MIKIWDMGDRSRPIYSRKIPICWIYDVEWDSYGMGVYVGGGGTASVLWDPLWSTPSLRSELYAHENKFAGIWRVKHFLFDQQTALVSVCSDGTVRCGFPSACGFHKKTPTSVGLVAELFRITRIHNSKVDYSVGRVENAGGGTGKGSAKRKEGVHGKKTCDVLKEGDQGEDDDDDNDDYNDYDDDEGTSSAVGPLCEIDVVCSSNTNIEKRTNIDSLPQFAAGSINAVDTTTWYAGRGNCNGSHGSGGGDRNMVLMGYGGSAGLLRVYICDEDVSILKS